MSRHCPKQPLVTQLAVSGKVQMLYAHNKSINCPQDHNKFLVLALKRHTKACTGTGSWSRQTSTR